jgi:hypothetical protein
MDGDIVSIVVVGKPLAPVIDEHGFVMVGKLDPSHSDFIRAVGDIEKSVATCGQITVVYPDAAIPTDQKAIHAAGNIKIP